MLSPDDRSTLLELLQPPTGFALDSAVATTYTLDLDALLTAPTAFAVTDSVSEAQLDGDLTPLELLDALRTQAGKITVCCDASGIKLPASARSGVMSFVERSIVPVRAPRGGVFHPKTWTLRFADATGKQRHRLLVSSRNLTFDRSWDTVVSLDEDPDGVALPSLATLLEGLLQSQVGVGSIGQKHQERIEALASSASRARFALPTGFDDMSLHVLGMSEARASRWPFPTEARRALVVSPFLTFGSLERLPGSWETLTVVSRADEVEKALADFADADDGPEIFEVNPSVVEEVPSAQERLNGLHAKLFVLDEGGGRSRVYTGSANATSAAFHTNVEVLIEFSGRTRDIGVTKWLDGDDCLRQLLMTHVWGTQGDETESLAQAALDELRRQVAQCPLSGLVSPTQGGRHQVTYAFSDITDLGAARLSLRPLSLKTWTPLPAGKSDVAFELETVALTALAGARLQLGDLSTEFTLLADLAGVPDDRDAQIMASLLEDPERLVRYLLMLLFDPTEDQFDGNAQDALKRAKQASGSTLSTVPLLEVMARALTRQKGRLAEIDRLLKDLEAGSDLVDPDLRALWASVRQVAGLAGSAQ